MWVGLILPLLGINKDAEPMLSIVTNEKIPTQPYSVYAVPQKEALEILSQSSPEAANWFKNHGYPEEGVSFTFYLHEAEVVK
jgi:hypothetical protein